MSVTDIIILVLAAAGGAFAVFRGIRPTLYLLIALLCSVLAIMYLTVPLENLLIRLSLSDREAYAGAPAVAVFILEGEDTMAYVASLIPMFLTVLILILFSVLGRIVKKMLTEPSRGAVSRITAVPVGIINGGIVSLLFAVQLMRLPRPLAGAMLRESIALNALTGVAAHLLPTLAGGM